MYQNNQVLNLNIDDILPNRFQPRIKFNEQAINELADSIKTHGVIQPIVVRKISDKYEIIAGERRYKASILAGKTTIPAIVVSLDDKNSAEIALIENVQRQNLTPIEEAISYKKILDMGYLNQVSLGEKLGKTQSTIANKLRLLNLNDEVQEALMDGKISERHARSLLRLNNDMQVVMLNRIINERLTVRKTDEEIEKILADSNNSGNQKIIEENNKMNNDILKDFNIPTEPIIEEFDEKLDQVTDNMVTNNLSNDVSSNFTNSINNSDLNVSNNQINSDSINNDTISEIPEFNNINNSIPLNESINPGFMDVDKIQNQAEEIYKEPEPIADMDMLLDTSNNPIIEQPVSPMQSQSIEEEENKEETPVGGKFFTMFNMNKEEDINPNYVSDIESKEVNMDFGVPNSNNNIFNFNPIENSEVISNNIDNSNESINSNSTVSFDTISTPEKMPDVETNQNSYFNSNQDLEKTMEFSQPINSYTLNDDIEFTNSVNDNIQNPVETSSDSISQNLEPISFEPIMNDELNNNIEDKIELPSESNNINLDMTKNQITYDDMGQIEVKIPEPYQKLTTANFKTVINTIRDCANTIEKFGFEIDTEEIDFEDSYQVTFKINKN